MKTLKYSLLVCYLLCLTCTSRAQDYKKYIQLGYEEIDSLMMIEYGRGAYRKAIPLMQAGREKAKAEFGVQDSVFAEYTANLGFFYTETGQYDKALPLQIQAKNIREKVLGKENTDFATSLSNLAQLYQGMGNPDKALPLYIQAKNIYEKVLGEEQPHFAISLNNLASLHQDMGNYDKALPLYIQAKNVREKIWGKENSYYASSLNNLALLHDDMGNYDKALHLLIEAKNIWEKALGKEHPYYAISLNNIAGVHKEMKNPDKALPFLIQAKNIYEKILGKEHPHFATSLNNLAVVHKAMGNPDKALPFYIQAKDIREKVLGKEHHYYASSLNNIAGVHKDMGNFDKAWNALYLAMNSQSGISVEHTFDNNWLDSLVNAPYPSTEHIRQMVFSLREAYPLLKKDSLIDDATTKQAVVADLATALLAKSRNQVSNDKDKLRMLSQSNDWLQKSLRVLNPEKHNSKAFNLSNQNKSVLLLQSTKSEAVYRLGNLPDSLVLQNKKMLKKQSGLQAKLSERRVKAEKDSLRGELIKVDQEIEDWVGLVKNKYPKYHRLKYQQADVKAEEIQALLDDKTALLEYVISDSVVHVFRVDKAEVQWIQQAVTADELKKKINGLHEVLSDYVLISKDATKSYKDYTESAHWFYQNLVEPALKGESGIKNLIIVADGELGHLPFETFLVEAAPGNETPYGELHYLLQDYNISYNYSATLWKQNMEAPKPGNNGRILGMAANYDIKLDTTIPTDRIYSDTIIRNHLSPLPAARKEVEALQKAFRGFFAFDTLANEKMIKKMASDYAVIHLAMHGLLNRRRPILSSLAFTEDSDSMENNFWQAHEISKMELNAELVVLSACETGYGKFEKGNGIASLARAFMYAGSSSLIVSLWEVSDNSTSRIMQNLYNNLAEGMRKDEALRQAKLEYIKNTGGSAAHPAFWSPFIQIGNTESMTIQRKGGGMLWWIIGGGIVLLIGLGAFVVRKVRNKEA